MDVEPIKALGKDGNAVSTQHEKEIKYLLEGVNIDDEGFEFQDVGDSEWQDFEFYGFDDSSNEDYKQPNQFSSDSETPSFVLEDLEVSSDENIFLNRNQPLSSTTTKPTQRVIATEMDEIVHKNLKVNGINMHVAEIGKGPDCVLFLHGFPELWYSWRHQMLHLSAHGYRAIAPDLRGYGDTDVPPSATSYTVFHVVGDLVALLDELGLEKVFLVGHDWGAMIAWTFCLIRPDKIKALVNTSIVFQPRNPAVQPIQGYRALLGDGFYMCRFQEPGKAEAAFASAGAQAVISTFLSVRDVKPPCIPVQIDLGALFKSPVALPSWLTEEDVNYYASKFDKTGFTGGLNYYRAMDLSWELSAAWTGSQIKVPVKFLIGDLDLTYHFPGVKDYIDNGGFKKYVPLLEQVVVMEGVAHFLNQERPEEVSEHIYDFIKKF
ncbi:UNVERIFIED_CONTAM: Epoxide hydrolase A [Sesamum calycinum]|uniref:soluble epoxide hydrolase n=1 Tax=Sesamum calycinum TaxID=2727403 RepID=A0AAW2MAI9_9LAMI